MAHSRQDLTRIDRSLSIYLGCLFLAYCAIFLYACPSWQLASAVFVEVLVFGLSLATLLKNPFRMPFKLMRFVAPLLRLHFSQKVIHAFQFTRATVLFAIVSLVTADFIAFSAAAFGDPQLACTVYESVPTSQLVGLHPAATLEMLTGAFVESHNLAKAEPLYFAVLAIRRRATGDTSDLVVALYADLGDLNIRKHDLTQAERWYRKAVEINAGTGRALTGLATVLREKRRFSESEKCYLMALKIRGEKFGRRSQQYHDTLRAYTKLLAMKQASRV